MTNEIENGDSLNAETDEQQLAITSDDIVVEDVDALKEKLTKTEEANRQLFVRAKKAEGFELKDGHWIKKPETKTEIKSETSVKSGELDSGQKALLRVEGIKSQDEVSLVKTYMENTGKDLEEVIENKYFLQELKEMRETKATVAATPSSSGRSTGATKDVDYWAAKYSAGTPINEVPQEFRSQALNAKIASEIRRDKFTDNLIA
jgi:hypothetical protein